MGDWYNFAWAVCLPQTFSCNADQPISEIPICQKVGTSFLTSRVRSCLYLSGVRSGHALIYQELGGLYLSADWSDPYLSERFPQASDSL
jgi:hypothetical protein